MVVNTSLHSLGHPSFNKLQALIFAKIRKNATFKHWAMLAKKHTHHYHKTDHSISLHVVRAYTHMEPQERDTGTLL